MTDQTPTAVWSFLDGADHNHVDLPTDRLT